QTGTLFHQTNRLEDALIIVVSGFAYDHIVRIDVVDGDAGVIEGIQQSWRADDVSAASWRLAAQKAGGGQRAGIKMAFVYFQSHTGQLLLQFLWGAFAGIGQEEKLFVIIIKPVYELLDAGQQDIAVIDHAVHIADKSFFLS